MAASGLLIKHSPTCRGFWYPCTRDQVKQVLGQHLQNWGRYHAVEGGETVVKTTDPKTLLCSFCTRAPTRPTETFADHEPVDAAAALA